MTSTTQPAPEAWRGEYTYRTGTGRTRTAVAWTLADNQRTAERGTRADLADRYGITGARLVSVRPDPDMTASLQPAPASDAEILAALERSTAGTIHRLTPDGPACGTPAAGTFLALDRRPYRITCPDCQRAQSPSVLEVRHVLESAGIAVRLTTVDPTPAGVRVTVRGAATTKARNVDRVRYALDDAHRYQRDNVDRDHVLLVTRADVRPAQATPAACQTTTAADYAQRGTPALQVMADRGDLEALAELDRRTPPPFDLPARCAELDHPGATWNPTAGRTWCGCGARTYAGNVADHVTCCGGPLDRRPRQLDQLDA